jgi:hypothetical protein
MAVTYKGEQMRKKKVNIEELKKEWSNVVKIEEDRFIGFDYSTGKCILVNKGYGCIDSICSMKFEECKWAKAGDTIFILEDTFVTGCKSLNIWTNKGIKFLGYVREESEGTDYTYLTEIKYIFW